jgi:CRP/FNR family cyclic AMP-dependent transcriptional regulator
MLRRRDLTLQRLRSVPLFQGLSKRDVSRILSIGDEVEFLAGQTIVEKGLQAQDFYLVLQGRAKLTVPGRKRGTLGPGDYFGEISVLDGGPRSANIVAETRIRLLRIDRRNFIPVLDRYGSIGRKILTEMCGRLRAAEAPHF